MVVSLALAPVINALPERYHHAVVAASADRIACVAAVIRANGAA